jgi:hypothetical protein
MRSTSARICHALVLDEVIRDQVPETGDVPLL